MNSEFVAKTEFLDEQNKKLFIFSTKCSTFFDRNILILNRNVLFLEKNVLNIYQKGCIFCAKCSVLRTVSRFLLIS